LLSEKSIKKTDGPARGLFANLFAESSVKLHFLLQL